MYWVPAAALGTPDNTCDQIFALKGKPEEAKRVINVLYEALVFIHLCTEPGSGNVKTQGPGRITWEFAKPAEVAIRDGVVNCAAAANIINYLLEDDYQEVGYIWWATDIHAAQPGGHDQNYIKYKDNYYFFDASGLAQAASHYPTEDGNSTAFEANLGAIVAESTPEKYASFVTKFFHGDQAIVAIYTADKGSYVLGYNGDVFYYPQAYDGSRLAIWIDPADSETLVEASYSPQPPSQYRDYLPYSEYLRPEGNQEDKPTIATMRSDG